jgi:hypothetical protein
MDPRQEGDRDHELTSSDGGVEQRWGLIDSEARPPQAQRTADQQLRPQTDQEVNAFKTLCPTTLACDAAARQALSAFAPDLQVTFLATHPGRATPRDDKRGRPGNGVQPAQVVDQSDGAVAASRTPRQARIAQHGCCILATNARDETPRTPQALLAGDKGHVQAERGCRFLQAPSVLASALDLKTPERLMALFMVMTVCLLVDAA